MDPEARTLPQLAGTYRALIIAIAVGVLLVAVLLVAWLAFSSPSVRATQILDSAIVAFNQNNFQTALSDTNGVLARDPHNVQALVTKATILAQEGSLTFQENTYGKQAQQLAQQAIALDASSSEAYRILGYSYEIRQMYPQAHANYQKAIALDPKNALAIFDDAHAWWLQGDTAKAETGYQQALAIDPNLSQARAGLAAVTLRSGDLLSALHMYERVASSSPNARVRAGAAYSAGSIELSFGTTTPGTLGGAYNFMTYAVNEDPTYPLGWTGMAKVLFEEAVASTTVSRAQRDALTKQSFADLKKALSIYQYQSAAHLQLALEYAVLGDTKDALTVLQGLPDIIAKDITLSDADKQAMTKQAAAIAAMLQLHSK